MTEPGLRFTEPLLGIVEFCAIECALQESGELSVSWMVRAWSWAMRPGRIALPTFIEVVTLGMIVEPVQNMHGIRTVGVRVGNDVKMCAVVIPRVLEQLCSDDAYASLSPAEWFKQYEDIHPFVDGNGRTGQILFNWIGDTLDNPRWAPNFWNDPRRHKGYGA